jgi:hypothetical protein
MLTPSDKELDRLSREAAEQFEPDETISSWEKLEPRLDTDLGRSPVPSSRRFGRGPIGYTALILLITGASYFLYKQDRKIQTGPSISKSNNESVTKNTAASPNAKQDNNQSLQTDVAKTKTNAAKSSSSQPDQIASQQGNDSKTEAGSPNNDATTVKPEVTAIKKLNKPTASQGNAITTVPSTKTGTEEPATSKGTSGSIKPETVKPDPGTGLAVAAGTIGNGQSKNPQTQSKKTGSGISGSKLPASGPAEIVTAADVKITGSSVNQVTVQSEKEPGLAILPGIEAISNHPPVIGSSLQVSRLSAANLDSSLSGPLLNNSAVKSRSLHLNRPLAIGIMLAPDITTVKGIAPDQFSGNIGITIGYQLTNRLSVNTGFISTKKHYSAQGKDFHLSTPYYIDFVKGDCNMYEIPLTVRYDFDAGDKTNFFINGGMSSYLMTHESYVYYTHDYTMWGTNTYTRYPKPLDDNRNYLFSVISLSAGIEHRIGKNLSLQGEPFVKIPLTGMGVGKLDLSSYGVSFSLRYSPVLKKSRR